MADACTNCPDYIKEAVRGPVRKSLAQVQSIQKLVNSVGAALEGTVEADLVAKVQAIVDAIPDPIVLDLSEIIGLLTCPLLPLAIAVDVSLIGNLDPAVLYRKVQEQIAKYIDKIVDDYEAALAALEEAEFVRLAKRFIDDLRRLEFDEEALVETLVITTYVAGVCPEEYTLGPYSDFVAAVVDFSFDGLIPSGLVGAAKDLMDALNEAEQKFLGWRVLVNAPVPF